MAGESLGTARLSVVIDTTQFDAAISKSKNAMAGFGEPAEAAFSKLNADTKRAATSLARYSENITRSADEQKIFNAAARNVPLEILEASASKINAVRIATENAAQAERELKMVHAFEQQAREAERMRRAADAVAVFTVELDRLEAAEAKLANQKGFITSLQQQAVAIGKTRAELLELKAAELGVTKEAAPFIAALKAQEKQLVNTGTQFNQYGLSVKQTQAALRQVPAQITDIFVSLQGGQNPLTVLLQQGGQLKDVFGGIRPAAAALGGALTRLINPYTLLAAATGSLIFLQVKAEQQMNAFNAALIQSGDISGRTAEDLNELAQSLDDMAGVSARGAAAAIAEVIATGRIAVENQEKVTRAALAMEAATGRAIKDTVAEFVELQRDPVAAILKLNESQHFLTEATLEQIQSLQEQGRTAEAAALAIDTYANVSVDKSKDIVDSLGLISGAWHSVKQGSSEALDGAVQFFIEADKRAKEAAVSIGRLKTAFSNLNPNSIFAVGFDNPFGEAPKPQKRPEETVAAVDSKAAAEFEALRVSNLGKEERQRLEIVRIQNLGVKAGKSQLEIDKQIAESNKRYTESLGKEKSGRGLANAESKADLQEFKDQLAVEQAAIQNNRKVLEANYAAKLITTGNYYAETKRLTEADTLAQERALLGQINALKARDVAGKDGIDTARQLNTLEAQLAKVRADGATSLIVLGIQEISVAEKRNQAIALYKQNLDLANSTLEKQTNAAIAAIGMGQREAAVQRDIAKAYDERDEALRRLQQDLSRGDIDQGQFDEETEAVRVATDRRVEIIQDGYRRTAEAEADWRNGAAAGIANWIDETSNVAKQVESITGGVLDKSADAIAEWAATGKLEVKSLLVDILKQILAFLAKQAVLKFVQAFGGAAGANVGSSGPGGGGWASAISAVIGGLGSGSSGGNLGTGTMPSGNWGSSIPTAKTQAASEGTMKSMAGGGNSVSISVTMNTDGTGSAKTTTAGQDSAALKQFAEQMRGVAQEQINKATQPGGSLWRVGVKSQ